MLRFSIGSIGRADDGAGAVLKFAATPLLLQIDDFSYIYKSDAVCWPILVVNSHLYFIKLNIR